MAANDCTYCLPETFLDYEPPRYEAEADTIVEHRGAPAREHNRAPIELKRGNGPATVDRYLALIRNVLRTARDEWHWIDSMPKVRLLPRAFC